MDKFFISEFQKDLWNDAYRFDEESIEGMAQRVAGGIFPTDQYHAELLAERILSRRISFGGRVLANVGTGYKQVYPFNCYGAQRSVKPFDSIANIYSDLVNAAQILKTEGGVGFNFNHIRPRGTLITGVRVGTPGAVAFMDLYDKSAEIITKGNEGDIFQGDDQPVKKKIRKGAMMSMLDVRHPDIEEYIEAKKIPNRLTKFNMSVIVTDSFMKAVIADEEFDLWFPNIHCDEYAEKWSGDFDEWDKSGLPKVVYKTVKARYLWDLIIKNTYNRNEPGIYFIDNANRYNNLSYYQKVTGTNPCGEISMLADAGVFEYNGVLYEHLGDICNLGHLNLVAYYDKIDGFDWDGFCEDIALLVRALDSLIDVSGYPLEGIKNAAFLRRKVGCGVLGYGSLLLMMGVRYGSVDANRFTENLMHVYANSAYQASAVLAHEKGAFPMYDEDQILNGGFIANSGILIKDTIDMIKQSGLRNSQLLTVAPTGSTGVLMGLVSGGMEPIFELEYVRWVSWNHRLEDLKELDYPKVAKGEWFETKDFDEIDRWGEKVLVSKCGTYMIDRNRGICRQIECEDYGWYWLKQNYTPEEVDEMKRTGVCACATDLTVEEHLLPFKIFSRAIDNSISKTINLKADYSCDDFSEMFIDLWESGARGVTTFREGTMSGVLEAKKEATESRDKVEDQQDHFFDIWEDHENGQVVADDVSLPEEYPMQGFKIRSEGKKWYFHVAFKDLDMTRPFAIFVQTNNRELDVNTFNAIEILEELAVSEGIAASQIVNNRTKSAGQSNVNKIARTLGLLLRHNVKVSHIVEALDKVDVPISSFIVRIKKFLMKYVQDLETSATPCPECGEKVSYREGCITCPECGWSKCA